MGLLHKYSTIKQNMRPILLLFILMSLVLMSGRARSQSEPPLLSDQARNGAVEIIGEGIGTTFSQPLLRLRVKLLSGTLVTGVIRPGQILRSNDTSACDVIALGLTSPVEVNTDRPETVSALLGYCLQLAPSQRSFPHERARYTLTDEMVSGATLGVLGLISPGDRLAADRIGVQLAVWAAENGVRERSALQAELPEYASLIQQQWPEINSLLEGLPFVAPSPLPAQATSGTGNLPTFTPASTATEPPSAVSSSNANSVLPVAALVIIVLILLVVILLIIRSVRTPTIIRPVADVVYDAPPPEVEKPNPWRQQENRGRSHSESHRSNPLPRQGPKPKPQRKRKGTELIEEAEPQQSGQSSHSVSMQDAVRVGAYTIDSGPSTATSSRSKTSNMRARTTLVMEPGPAEDQKTYIELRPLEHSARDATIAIQSSGGLISRGEVEFIEVDDDTVSDPHAMLIIERNQVFIRDLHSKSGTKIQNEVLLPAVEERQDNGQKVLVPNERRLMNHDRISIGRTELEYRSVTQEIIFPHGERRPISLRRSDRWLLGRRKLAFAVEENSRTPFGIFNNQTVSMPHAKLALDRFLYIQDLNSGNGTYHNNLRLPAGERVAIYDGAMIRIGSLGFEVVIGEDGFQKGKPIGKYQLIRHIASGNMANIWKAHNIDFGSERALKIPRLGHFLRNGETGDEFRKAFSRELEISNLLIQTKREHSNLVRMHETGSFANESGSGSEPSIPYLVMELIDGKDMGQYLTENQMVPQPEVFEVIRQVALGVLQLHELGWMHGDIKPENILIRRDGSGALLTDFGAARRLDDEDGGAIFTSRQYVPQDYLDNRMPDPSVDLYMIAATLFEMISGEAWRELDEDDLLALPGRADNKNPSAQRAGAATRQIRPLKSDEERLRMIVNTDMRNTLAQALQSKDRKMSLPEFVQTLEPHCQGSDLTRLVSAGSVPA